MALLGSDGRLCEATMILSFISVLSSSSLKTLLPYIESSLFKPDGSAESMSNLGVLSRMMTCSILGLLSVIVLAAMIIFCELINTSCFRYCVVAGEESGITRSVISDDAPCNIAYLYCLFCGAFCAT